MPSERSIPPVEVYKQIIDGLVKDSPSLGARLVAEEGIYSKAPAHQPLNALVQRLTSEERSVLLKSVLCSSTC
jgi:hypothetical protein